MKLLKLSIMVFLAALVCVEWNVLAAAALLIVAFVMQFFGLKGYHNG